MPVTKCKPRGKPFTGKGDPRNNLKGRPTKARETAKSFAECFVKLMNKEVSASIGVGGETVVRPNYEHFLSEMIKAGIKGTGAGTSARKLVLDFMAQLETKEQVEEDKQAATGETADDFSWDAAKQTLYEELKAAGKLRSK